MKNSVIKQLAGVLALTAFALLPACAKDGGLTHARPDRVEPKGAYTLNYPLPLVWETAIEALGRIPDAEILAAVPEEGTITLRTADVDPAESADCGSIQGKPLQGKVRREASIVFVSLGPRETRMAVRAAYSIRYGWYARDGCLVQKEIIPCVSTCRFENKVHAWIKALLERKAGKAERLIEVKTPKTSPVKKPAAQKTDAKKTTVKKRR